MEVRKMGNPTIELSRKQVVNALIQFSPMELKKILDELFRQKSFAPPTLDEITKEAGKIVKERKLKRDVIQEAIKWARPTK